MKSKQIQKFYVDNMNLLVVGWTDYEKVIKKKPI